MIAADDGAVREKFAFGKPEPDGILNNRTKLGRRNALRQRRRDGGKYIPAVES